MICKAASRAKCITFLLTVNMNLFPLSYIAWVSSLMIAPVTKQWFINLAVNTEQAAQCGQDLASPDSELVEHQSLGLTSTNLCSFQLTPAEANTHRDYCKAAVMRIIQL